MAEIRASQSSTYLRAQRSETYIPKWNRGSVYQVGIQKNCRYRLYSQLTLQGTITDSNGGTLDAGAQVSNLLGNGFIFTITPATDADENAHDHDENNNYYHEHKTGGRRVLAWLGKSTGNLF